MRRKLHPFTDMDFSLMSFDEEAKDSWTISDAVRGTQIFGGIGSGKTSGSGKAIAKSFLQNGFGGLVLCAKKEEKDNWVRYAKETGREDSLLVVSAKGDLRFNILDYEMNRQDGGGQTRNIVNLFMNIHQMGDQNARKGGEDRFWDSALKRLLTNIVDLLALSQQTMTVTNMYRVIQSAPSDEQFQNDMEIDADAAYEAWLEKSFCLRCLDEAWEPALENDEEHLYEMLKNFWINEFSSIPDKTRSTITESFYGLAEPLARGLLYNLFSTSTNFLPEYSHNGYIIILDISIQEYLELGKYAQCIFKLIWQQAVERRKMEQSTRPVFLWVDEAQLFLNEYDMIFQTTCRSSKCAVVFLSQNINNYYSVVGGSYPQYVTDSLLGNLSTKIFHANNDHVTNKWATETIGKAILAKSTSLVGQVAENQSTVRGHAHLQDQVEPREFSLLKNGGQQNNFNVEAYITIAGRTLSNNSNYRKIIFNQKL